MAGRISFLSPSEREQLKTETANFSVIRVARRKIVKASGAEKAELPKSGCRICKRDDDHAHLMLCEGCNGEYHTKCLVPPLQHVPTGDWFCGDCGPICSQNCSEQGLGDGLEELVSALPPRYTSRFAEICWANGGPGYGWWPSCIYDPRLTTGNARSLGRRNVGKKHLLYFFQCDEAPFAVVEDLKISTWEQGLAEDYYMGRTAQARGRKRYTQFRQAFQAAIIENNKPMSQRLQWNQMGLPPQAPLSPRKQKVSPEADMRPKRNAEPISRESQKSEAGRSCSNKIVPTKITDPHPGTLRPEPDRRSSATDISRKRQSEQNRVSHTSEAGHLSSNKTVPPKISDPHYCTRPEPGSRSADMSPKGRTEQAVPRVFHTSEAGHSSTSKIVPSKISDPHHGTLRPEPDSRSSKADMSRKRNAEQMSRVSHINEAGHASSSKTVPAKISDPHHGTLQPEPGSRSSGDPNMHLVATKKGSGAMEFHRLERNENRPAMLRFPPHEMFKTAPLPPHFPFFLPASGHAFGPSPPLQQCELQDDSGLYCSVKRSGKGIGFICLPSRKTSTFQDARIVIEEELELDSSWAYRFVVPGSALGPVSLKQETKLGPMLKHVQQTIPACDGSATFPAVVELVDASPL